MNKSLLFYLIDDDQDDQEIFAYAVQEVHPDIDCFFANDGMYALEKINSDPSFLPDYIFLDINMPRMNGIECLRELKKHPRIADIPVYMYSTTGDSISVAKCIQLGASGYIQKVADLDELQSKVKRIISE